MTEFKVDNAVILAAGFSSRFVPVCFDMPKGLLPVRGETLIERQICQLREAGIDDIFVITGAYAEQFDFLKRKHNCELIFNPDFAAKNNFASVYAARDILGNTMVSSSDLYFTKNIFQGAAEHSYYASVFAAGKTRERSLTLDENDRIIGVKNGGKDNWITFGGQAFFTRGFSQKLVEIMRPAMSDPKQSTKYWVDFQDENLSELPMYIKRCETGGIVEFNTLESLWKFDRNFCACDVSATMRKICKEINCADERQLSGIAPVKRDNTTIGCKFAFNGKIYEWTCSGTRLVPFQVLQFLRQKLCETAFLRK